RLSLAEGAAHHRSHRVDGGTPLPPAALRLSRGCAERIEPSGDAGDHGAAAVARHHAAGGGDELWVRRLVGGDPRGRRLAPRVDLGKTRSRRSAHRLSYLARVLAPRPRPRRARPFVQILSI